MNIDKINIAIEAGQNNKDIQEYNEIGWKHIEKIVTNHSKGSRTNVIEKIIDEMYENSVSEKPKNYKEKKINVIYI